MVNQVALSPPPPGKSVKFEDFLRILYIFSSSFSGGGGTKVCGQEFYGRLLGAKKQTKEKHIHKIFTGLSRDFGGISFMCFSPP